MIYRRVHRAFFIPAIIFLCCLQFGVMMHTCQWQFAEWQYNPMWGPSLDVLIAAGAQTTELVVDDGEWPRMGTSLFVHAGVIHLGLNAMGLFNVGYQLEQAFGSGRVAVIYFASGIFASALSAIFLPQFVCVGASGAIFGLFGCIWSDFLQNRVFDREERCCSKGGTCLWLFWNTAFALAFTLLPMVNAFAHIGGFLFGMLLGNTVIVQDRWRKQRQSSRLLIKNEGIHSCQRVIMLVSVVLLLGASLWAYVTLYSEEDVYDKCDWCRVLQCFDTQWWSCDSYASDGQAAAGGDDGE